MTKPSTQQPLLVGLVVPAPASTGDRLILEHVPVTFDVPVPTPRKRPPRPPPEPAPRTKAERQVEVVRLGLQRLARGSDYLIARAARRLLRQLHEVE